MAQPILCLQWLSGSIPTVGTSTGSAFSALAGALDREPTFTGSVATALTASHSAIQSKDNVIRTRYAASAGDNVRIYALDRNALKLTLTGDPTGSPLPVAGETVTNSASPAATGTLIEDYVAGDNFIKYVPTANTFGNNDALTFGGGTTATVSASGNPEDNGGEFGVEFETTNLVRVGFEVPLISGIFHYVRPDGDLGLAFMFENSAVANRWYGMTFDFTTQTWTETNIGSDTLSINTSFIGHSYMKENVLHFTVSDNSNEAATNRSLVAWNPNTGSFASRNLSNAFNVWRNNMVQWQGQLWTMGFTTSFGQDTLRLLTVTGASESLMDSISNGGAANGDRKVNLIVGHDNALYGLTHQGGTGNLIRWHYDSNNNLIRDSLTQPTDSNNLGRSGILPASLATGASNQTLFNFVDMETTPGSKDIYFWVQENGAAAIEYKVVDWTNLDSGSAASYTSTATLVSEITFSVDPGVIVGDWVRNVTTNQAFRVSAIAVGGDATVIEVTGITSGLGDNAPGSGSAVWQKANQWTEESSSGSMIGISFPSSVEGGGEYIYTLGERHIEITGVTPGVGVEILSFEPRSDGGDTVSVRGYWIDTNGTINAMSLQNPSQGSISGGNTNINVVADGNTKTVEWLADSDGATNQNVRRYLRIFT